MVTIVIPAFNEERHIAACLAALEAQTLPCDRFEVVLVDNGSSDNTLSVAKESVHSFALRIVSRPGINVSAVRNFGASLGHGEIIAFLDADCIVESEWLSDAIRLAPAKGIWGAHYRVPANATWIARTWFRYQATEQDGEASFIPSSNMFLWRRDFDSLKGFDEAIRTSEDVELCARARGAKMPVIAFPALAVVHEGVPRSITQFYRQNRWHGAQLLKLFVQNLPSTRNLRLIAISVYTFVTFWAMLVAIAASLIFHSWVLPVLLLALLLLPPVLLSIRKAGARPAFATLTVLYLVYLLARAAALTDTAPMQSWKHSRQPR